MDTHFPLVYKTVWFASSKVELLQRQRHSLEYCTRIWDVITEQYRCTFLAENVLGQKQLASKPYNWYLVLRQALKRCRFFFLQSA